jgi:hypothetical protein
MSSSTAETTWKRVHKGYRKSYGILTRTGWSMSSTMVEFVEKHHGRWRWAKIIKIIRVST